MEKPNISDCGTHHVNKSGQPIYSERFNEVLAFHEVDGRWIAPAQRKTQAFHIDVGGNPIYGKRFTRCFGFYHGFAAVIDDDGWHHIMQDGTALYEQRYGFVGNYQENMVVVMDHIGNYFHLNSFGEPLYPERWAYCGDFRDGIAVVQSLAGLSTHIRTDGSLLHGQWFSDLDIYHKGFARAKAVNGWCHIDKSGSPIYRARFGSVEPFYNGVARCESHDEGLLLISERGKTIRHLRKPTRDNFSELSADMVGYWKTYTIASAVSLGVFENLPGKVEQLADSCKCQLKKLHRLMSALQELDLVVLDSEVYRATEKGGYLSSTHPLSLFDAAGEYANDLLKRWQRLPSLIQGEVLATDIFCSVANDNQRVYSHHRMLASYALHDYKDIISLLPISQGETVLDAGGGTGTLARLIQVNYPDSKVFLGDLEPVLNVSDFPHKIELDFFKSWQVKTDVIVLARVLHDWPDSDAIKILANAKKALLPNGKILILEMLLDKQSPSGSLCDLHLLTVTGGQERCQVEFEQLAQRSELRVESVVKVPNALVSVLILVDGDTHG